MEIYLTDDELKRESNLFAPGESQYALPESEPFDVRQLPEQLAESDNLPEPPSSC